MTEQSFRRASLERLGSSEEFELPIRVTTPMGWISLLATGGLVLVVIFWSIFGRISTEVAGQGVLIRTGGVFAIVALSTGQLSDVYVDEAENVERGQVVARIAQPTLLEKIKHARGELAELKDEHQRMVEFTAIDIEVNKESLDNQRSGLSTSVQFARERIKWLNERLANQSVLLDRGLITKQAVLLTRQEINKTKEEIEANLNQIQKVSVQELEFKEQKDREVRNSRFKIAQKERELAELENLFEESSKIVSPYTGRILEISVDEGRMVEPGKRIMSLEYDRGATNSLQAAVYIPSTQGKKVQPGMRAHISPSTVKREEYGFMVGTVTQVSEFPATSEGMMRILQNESMVETLSSEGAPNQVFVSLITDPNTISGYKWSSSKGPPARVESGTLCSSMIVVSERSPISLVVPMAKKALLGE